MRDLSHSTFATPERPTAAPLVNTVQTTQRTRTFSSTGTSGARRAWLPYKQHEQRKLKNGRPSTEQDQPAQNHPSTEADLQYSPETVRAILGNLKIPVWKRATITKVRHHFDDVQWAGQKDRSLLIRRTKTNAPAPASGSPEPQLTREPAKKMVMYHPGGSTNSKIEAEMFDEYDPNPFLEPASSTGLPKLDSTTSPTSRGGSRRSKDKRTLSTPPKRPDTNVNEWDFDASPWGQSKRSFSTTHRLDKSTHKRRTQKRRLKRAERGLPPVIHLVVVAPRPVTSKISQKPKPERETDAGSTPDSSRAQHAPVPLPSKRTPQNRSPKTNGPRNAPQKTARAGATGLPRILRQLRGEVAPRQPHERANGEVEQDFAKLEGFLWKGYYTVVSSVRKIEREVPMKNAMVGTKRRKGEVKLDGAVRKIRIETRPSPDKLPGKLSPDELVQQCFASMQTTGKYLAMLTKQLEGITRLDSSQLPTWIASQRQTSGSRSPGRKRRLIRTVRLPSPSTRKAKSRPRITIPRRRKLPHRNPSGLDFIMRSFPFSLPSTSTSPHTPSSPPSPDPVGPGAVPFYSFFNRSMLVNIVRHRPELLRKQILPGLHHHATRMIRRAQLLSAQTRALVPSAPIMISAHATLPAPRAKAPRRPASPSSAASAQAPETRARHVRRSMRNARSQRKRVHGKAVRARRVPLGGWKHMYKYFSGRRAPRIRKYAEGELLVKKVARKSPRQELADDVEGWLTGDALDGMFR